MPPRSDATDLLVAWSNGDQSAFERLVPLVYQELRVLAQRYMRRERPDHTLQATALVNEAYVRLIDVNRIGGRTARISLPSPRRRWDGSWWSSRGSGTGRSAVATPYA